MSRSTVSIVAIVAILALVAAAVLFASGDDALQRVGLLVGLTGPTLLGLLADARADAAARTTDATSWIA